MTHRSITALLDARRLAGLETTPGGRIVAKVSAPDAKGTSFRSSLVEILGASSLPLTRGSASVGSVALAEDGATLFTAQRVGEDGEEADDAQLWALPSRGEAREVASRPGGFGGLHLANGVLVAEIDVHSQASDEAEHARLSRERKKSEVSAALHDGFPTRHWDHDLGPARSALAVAALPEDLFSATATAPADQVPSGDDDDAPRRQVLHFRHLEMPPGRLSAWSADRQGRRALAAMTDSLDDRLGVGRLYLLDLTGTQPPQLLRDATNEVEFWPGEFSPDGTRVLISRERTWTQTASARSRTEVLDLATGESREVWPELDRDPHPTWVDGDTLVGAGDDEGRGSVWIGGLGEAAPRRLAGGPDQELSFAQLAVAGGAAVASASGIAVAPHPVRIDLASGEIVDLPNPADAVEQPGTLTEVSATAQDGTALRAWLRLPEGEGPHPLVVFAHGGPWGSWNAWTSRWNPGPFVDAGYAVLLPDPAISTGYGQEMIDRGQHELGGAPFTDIMALADATVARADIDAERTAFAGGSYGGYMANWVAGHTGDRFRCVVTHASLWDTASMGRTTDNAGWERPMREQNRRFNPKDSVAEIQVPMLVIHGDKDCRVPIAQGHALWYDLHEFSATPRDEQGRTRHRFLYFPDEGHWITGRGNAQVWYETFLGFLDQHVRGIAWHRPAALG
ncbi:S9 family peptidase [Brachybacterium subflavum]|uniref:S9 family peptidase n=1 Tax=Brachybacterium subflavum TaxID=2585206 RepID=UPI0012660A00|nr:alpha/beta fold hydrolase [Brachybacterium subflavum]